MRDCRRPIFNLIFVDDLCGDFSYGQDISARRQLQAAAACCRQLQGDMYVCVAFVVGRYMRVCETRETQYMEGEDGTNENHTFGFPCIRDIIIHSLDDI